jgi:hypothetical protein
MGLLGRRIALALALASGCYAPDVRDCTVSCTAETDCAAGQVCGADRFCAAPPIAGRCASLPDDAGVHDDGSKLPVDAAPVSPPPDAKPDAPPPPPPTTTVHVKVDGQGRITVQGGGTCASGMPQNGDCSFTMQIGEVTSAVATPNEDQRFDKWTTTPCIVEPSSTCNFTVLGPTDIHGKFRKED